MEKPKLTRFSHGSGCGCKIAPADLEEILRHAGQSSVEFRNLLVGNGTNDDAAVMDLGDGNCVISTADFFTPIVDDARDFGRIASANALSDVYAMGGTPLMAVALLGWPVETLGKELAAEVISGARALCNEVGIPLAGGHSIDSREPFFGLAVTGLVKKEYLKRNSTAQDGDLIYLTKNIGTGILSTAMKRGLLQDKYGQLAIDQMCSVNTVGAKLGQMDEVHAMTDVTGFGLLGHLLEMCEGAKLGAEIEFESVPTLSMEALAPLLDRFVMPDNTMRNFKAYSSKCSKLSARQLQILCDPQTNGGLLIAVDPKAKAQAEALLEKERLNYRCIGFFGAKKGDTLVQVS